MRLHHPATAAPTALAQMVTRTKKVFVGGLSAQTTLEDVRAYFEQFGLVSWRAAQVDTLVAERGRRQVTFGPREPQTKYT